MSAHALSEGTRALTAASCPDDVGKASSVPQALRLVFRQVLRPVLQTLHLVLVSASQSLSQSLGQ